MLRQHSPAFYKLDECISAVQKSIRRGLVREAMFWAFQIGYAGYSQYLLKKLLATITTEDIGFGWTGAPGLVVSAFEIYQKHLKVSKTSISNAMTLPTVQRLIAETVTCLARAPKSRCVATASGLATSFPPSTAANEKEARKDVDTWLALVNQEYNLDHPCVLSGDLLEMRKLKMGSARQLVFFEALKDIWPDKGNCHSPGLGDGVQEFLDTITPNARWYAVPDFALDKHTERGRGVDTSARAAAFAQFCGKPVPADLEKSHGKGEEHKDQIAFFFDVGAKVENELFPDPFFDRCRAWYLKVAQQHGWQEAKTKKMIRRWLDAYKNQLAEAFITDICGSQSKVFTDAELVKIKALPHGQKRTAHHKKVVYMSDSRVWKGPYTPEAAKQIADREAFFALVSRTPFLGLVQSSAGVFLEMESLVDVPENEWKTQEVETKVEKATVVARESTGVQTCRSVVWTFDLAAEAVIALCARAVTKTGDSHLGNLLLYNKHVYSVDCEDTRMNYPEDGEWHDWLFSKKPAQEVLRHMEHALKLNRGNFKERLEAFEKHLTNEHAYWKEIKEALFKIM